MLIAAIATAMLAQPPAPVSSSPLHAAAERLAKATSLQPSEMFGPLQTNLPPERRKALEAAMVESHDDASALRDALADAYARHLTLTEIEGAVAFFESSAGASFERKMLKRQGEAFSAEETQAARAFLQSPAGAAYQAKWPIVGEDMRPALKSFSDKLMSRAQAIHCRATNECGPFLQPPAASPPAPARP